MPQSFKHRSMEIVTHPGKILNELFKERDISQREFASIINIAHSHLSDILNEKKPINPSIAISLEAAEFKTAVFWMSEQMRYQIDKLKKNEDVLLKTDAIRSWNDYRNFIPVRYFKGHGILNDDVVHNVNKINEFYGVVDAASLESKINKFEFTRYRKSSALQTETKNIIGWEILAESQLRTIKIINKFNGKHISDLISDLNAIFYKNDKTIEKVKKTLTKYGIRFSTLDRPSKTPVDGKTFKVDSDPAICLTLKYKRLDNFAYTLMHEIGHVYHHISQSNDYTNGFYSDFKALDLVKEEAEADKFATDALIPQKEWDQFYYNFNFTDAAIKQFSRRIKVHAAIIRGRVCHKHTEYYRKRTSINATNETT